jgi:predicted 2-oxoglutarate/Fe(II)-dependent dioxygenase YbiX
MNKMNLIQQLQATPKWKEFEKWYSTYYGVHKAVNINLYQSSDYLGFTQLPFEFQKGMFEKFIKNNGFEIHFDGSYNLYKSNKYIIVNDRLPNWISFEQLLIWYFNN